jgi:hypothetical protein
MTPLSKDCLMFYRGVRRKLTAQSDASGEVILSSNDSAFEVSKNDSKGILSWKPEVNWGLMEKLGLKAMTGFQSRYLDREFLVYEFRKSMSKTSSWWY